MTETNKLLSEILVELKKSNEFGELCTEMHKEAHGLRQKMIARENDAAESNERHEARSLEIFELTKKRLLLEIEGLKPILVVNAQV